MNRMAVYNTIGLVSQEAELPDITLDLRESLYAAQTY